MSLDATINIGTVVAGSNAKPVAANSTYIYARWTGYLVPTVSGVYTLGVNADGGVNLFIGDTPLIQSLASALVPNSTTSYNTSTQIELTAGVYYPVTLEWQHSTGSYQIQLLWTAPGGSVAVIPSANLSTSKTSVTGNLSGLWWNGTSGLWYPSGPGIIDFANASQVNKNQDNVSDGSTFKRLLYVNSDNTIHVSTALNPQASVLPNQVVLVTISMPNATTMNITWLQQSLTRADGSTFTVLPSSAALGATLLTNGDGESGTLGSQEPNWTFLGGNGLLTANDFVNSGTKSMKVINATAADSFSYQEMNVTDGQVYCLQGYIKTSGVPSTAGRYALLNMVIISGVTSFTILNKTTIGADPVSTTPSCGIVADGASHGFTLVQCVFRVNGSGVLRLYCQLGFSGTVSGTAWFDDVAVIPAAARSYTVTASTGYYLYSYIDAIAGLIKFVNGAPPPTSPSDTLAQQCSMDGRYVLPSKHVTTPASGGTGTDTGGGSGTCPEFDAPVFVRRYSDAGELQFEGEIRAGEVCPGYESDEVGPDGETRKRGYFLKGYSFARQADVFRAVQQVSHVPCAGWMKIDGVRYTACETVWDGPLDGGHWLPAWKVSGAVLDNSVGVKVLIQVEADWDDEHNYYAGARLIHNGPILPC